ncbi:hypothetical protein K490DRAFT_42967 [Saccharata proteae CBS 121410]|uniref:Spo12-like protein n=1 Tax=Saccharata proteae CBS 121410 TaxID=1314787 RepID=A0A9P4LWU9_9PEZI|nr:hypothetical protein K490DRAFT_42967 [Saccharata proteae CBS 121410]
MANNNVLSDRDTNAQLNTNATMTDDSKPKSMEYHRQVLEQKLQSGQYEEGTYISPSDGIQSPATQKLAAFKNKHGMKKTKPQTLFGKMSARNMAASDNSGAMFADIPQNKDGENSSDASS